MTTVFKAHPTNLHPIEYFGIVIYIPIGQGIAYIATDADGEVFGFTCCPNCTDIWITDYKHNAPYNCVHIATITYDGNWKDSLLYINDADLTVLNSTADKRNMCLQ